MYFLKNKTFTAFLLVLSVLVGGYFLQTISKEFYPEIKVPIVVIQTVYPGASATEVEESVTNSLEDVLIGGLDDVDEISSSSQEGVSVISIQFDDSIDVNQALVDVKDKIDQKKGDLPENANEPIVSKVNFSDQPVFTFALSSREAFNKLRGTAEDIENTLLRIPGVSSISIGGIPEREINILLDPDALLRYSLSPYQISQVISSAEQTLPIGSVVVGERNYRLDFSSQISDVSDLESVVVQQNGDGSYIYLRDVVVSIEDGLSTELLQSRIAVDIDAPVQQALVFDVRKQGGGDITELTQNVKIALQKFQTEYSGELEFVTVFDAGEEIQTNLSELVGSGMQTIVLVLLVMGLMVGFRESLIAALAVPLSFLLTFIGMYFMGQTINFITLFSLILVIGILIDSAVVIVEGIHDFKSEGATFDVAVEKTLREFSKPVIAGVMTTISIFVPLLTLSGTLGQFIGGIPRVINIVLVMSIVVALIFVPLVARYVYGFTIGSPAEIWRAWKKSSVFNGWSQLNESTKKSQNFFQLLISWFVFVGYCFGYIIRLILRTLKSIVMIAISFVLSGLGNIERNYIQTGREKIFRQAQEWYAGFLEKFLSSSTTKRGLGIGLIILFFSSFVLVGTGLIRSEFFPPDEVSQAYINIELPQGSLLEQTSEKIAILEERIYDIAHVESFTSTIGSENVFVGGGRSGEHYGSIVVNVDEKENGVKVTQLLRDAFSDIYGFQTQVLVPESGPPVGAPVQINIVGSEWESMHTAAEMVASHLESFTSTRDVDSGVDTGVTNIQLRIRNDRLVEYGLSAFELSANLRAIIYGSTATSMTLPDVGETDIKVKVQLNRTGLRHTESNHVTYDDIKNLSIVTPRGPVLLGYLVEEDITQATSTARHKDGERIITVTSYVQDGYLPIDVVNEFNETITDVELPADVEYSVAGATDENDQASAELTSSLGLGVLLIFGVLIWQFGSIRDTLFIVSVIPLALVGVLYGLFIVDKTLSFTAMLGFISLVGIVVNDSIILVDVMNTLRLRNPEIPKRDVVVQGASMRLRPVLLTTITTVLGMVPLLFVSPLWEPFAYAVITGLSFSTILTLVVVPMLYDKWSR